MRQRHFGRFAIATGALAACAFAIAACETTVNLGDGADAAGALDGSGAEASAAEAAADSGAAPGSDANASDTSADARDASSGPKGIFLSRGTYTPDFGGIMQADARCQSSAAAASLGGKWRAWISDSTHDAASRFVSDGPWIAAVTNVELFHNRAGLKGFPLAALLTDELGKPAPDRWWTGTLVNGLRSPTNCSDWTTGAMFASAMTGSMKTAGVPGKEWTEDEAFSCQDTFALLCLEDE